MSLEVFAVTEFNNIFSGGQQRQGVKFSNFSGTDCVTIFGVLLRAW